MSRAIKAFRCRSVLTSNEHSTRISSSLCHNYDSKAPAEYANSQNLLSLKAPDEPSTGVLSEKVTGIDHFETMSASRYQLVSSVSHTSREVVELFALKTEGLLISKEVGVVQGCFVHEL